MQAELCAPFFAVMGFFLLCFCMKRIDNCKKKQYNYIKNSSLRKKVYIMDLQYIADSFRSMACVLSAEKTDDGRSCDIRIVTGNKAFMELAEHPPHRQDNKGMIWSMSDRRSTAGTKRLKKQALTA